MPHHLRPRSISRVANRPFSRSIFATAILVTDIFARAAGCGAELCERGGLIGGSDIAAACAFIFGDSKTLIAADETCHHVFRRHTFPENREEKPDCFGMFGSRILCRKHVKHPRCSPRKKRPLSEASLVCVKVARHQALAMRHPNRSNLAMVGFFRQKCPIHAG